MCIVKMKTFRIFVLSPLKINFETNSLCVIVVKADILLKQFLFS